MVFFLCVFLVLSLYLTPVELVFLCNALSSVSAACPESESVDVCKPLHHGSRIDPISANGIYRANGIYPASVV
jgi:hypothetical protein